MQGVSNISLQSLLISSSLILVTLFFSYSQKLKLEKEILIGAFRAVIQLTLVGYFLNIIFGYKSPLFTLLLVLVMIFNAAYNASKRGKNINKALFVSFVSIALGTFITLLVLLISKIISFEAYKVIPISGMLVGNSMVAVGLCYKQLDYNFKNKNDQVEARLSLGADILPASIDLIRDSIKTGMLPTIDSTKTLGIVSLPGMMTGLILAGSSPLNAIKYQIMVTFMLLSATSIASFIACYLGYKSYFNNRKQLI